MKLITLLVLCLTASQVFGQMPIPQGGPDGWVSGNYGVPIVIDAFYDFLCPASKEMDTNFQAVIDFYGNNLQFVLHAFPLPYHHNAFQVAQGAQVVASTGNNSADTTAQVFAYKNIMFANQDAFSNAATSNMTLVEVQSMIAKYSSSLVDTDTMIAGLQYGNDYDNDARVAWKYACSRAVVGTPSMFVNGAYVPADPSWSLADWQAVLSGLTPSTTCPTGQKSCEYIPGQFQCCTVGEACVPNVGCRC